MFCLDDINEKEDGLEMEIWENQNLDDDSMLHLQALLNSSKKRLSTLLHRFKILSFKLPERTKITKAFARVIILNSKFQSEQFKSFFKLNKNNILRKIVEIQSTDELPVIECCMNNVDNNSIFYEFDSLLTLMNKFVKNEKLKLDIVLLIIKKVWFKGDDPEDLIELHIFNLDFVVDILKGNSKKLLTMLCIESLCEDDKDHFNVVNLDLLKFVVHQLDISIALGVDKSAFFSQLNYVQYTTMLEIIEPLKLTNYSYYTELKNCLSIISEKLVQ